MVDSIALLLLQGPVTSETVPATSAPPTTPKTNDRVMKLTDEDVKNWIVKHNLPRY